MPSVIASIDVKPDLEAFMAGAEAGLLVAGVTVVLLVGISAVRRLLQI